MKEQVHILNGDSLKERFPEELSRTLIVLRECLVDGSVKGETLEDFYKTRASFLEVSTKEYAQKTISEFEKIKNIPAGVEVNLWFEDDLFCQVNFWFTCHLLKAFGNKNSIYLIRPRVHTQYGFSEFDKSGLMDLFEEKKLLNDISVFQSMWILYQKGATSELFEAAKSVEEEYPFVLPAVKAHLERIPNADSKSKPVRVLEEIMKELETQEFGPVFQEFNKREPIYGFGDMQVKRIFDQILDQ